jgi:hypothetical protein
VRAGAGLLVTKPGKRAGRHFATVALVKRAAEAADQRRHQARGHLRRGDDGTPERVGQADQHRAQQRGDRQHPPVAGADQGAGGVRAHQAELGDGLKAPWQGTAGRGCRHKSVAHLFRLPVPSKAWVHVQGCRTGCGSDKAAALTRGEPALGVRRSGRIT